MHPKYTIIFVFLILAFKATGQELPLGTFSLSTGFTYRQFTFKENNRFDYLFSSCTGGEKGSGTFVYENKNLTLTFTDSIGKTEPLKPVFTKENSATDTSLIHFILFDQKDSAKLSGVTLKWKKNDLIHFTMSNSNGTARFNIANNDLPTEIEISYLGVKPLLFPVKEAGNYTVKFALNPQEFIMPLEKGNQLHFVVNKIKSNEIFLREEKHETKFYKYNRRQ